MTFWAVPQPIFKSAESMIPRILILFVACFLLMGQLFSFASGACINPEYQPYAGDTGAEKLVCWVKRDNDPSNLQDGVLLAPLNKKSWVAWIYQTLFFAEPIEMAVTYNDCKGLGLYGIKNDDIYSLSIVGFPTAELTGSITKRASLETIKFVGECQFLPEDQYTINIQEGSSKQIQPTR